MFKEFPPLQSYSGLRELNYQIGVVPVFEAWYPFWIVLKEATHFGGCYSYFETNADDIVSFFGGNPIV